MTLIHNVPRWFVDASQGRVSFNSPPPTPLKHSKDDPESMVILNKLTISDTVICKTHLLIFIHPLINSRSRSLSLECKSIQEGGGVGGGRKSFPCQFSVCQTILKLSMHHAIRTCCLNSVNWWVAKLAVWSDRWAPECYSCVQTGTEVRVPSAPRSSHQRPPCLLHRTCKGHAQKSVKQWPMFTFKYSFMWRGCCQINDMWLYSIYIIIYI